MLMTARGLCVLGLALGMARADGPKDNIPDNVRRIPPPGIMLSPKDRQMLANGVDVLGKQINSLRTFLQKKQSLLDFAARRRNLPQRRPLRASTDEFFKPAEIDVSREAAASKDMSARRSSATARRPGRPRPAWWCAATSRRSTARCSRTAWSCPPSYQPGPPSSIGSTSGSTAAARRSARSISSTTGRRRPGEFTPPDTFVLHPYGRYCNANKFAGEIDMFEALEHVRSTIRSTRTASSVRGFSMGGAACWQFAVHYSGRWAAAAPGRGLLRDARVPEGLPEGERSSRPGTSRSSGTCTTAPTTRVNLFNCPTVAYSGENDRRSRPPT